MPTIHDFATTVQGADEGSQLRLNADLEPVISGANRVGNFLAGRVANENKVVMDSFKAALTTAYGEDAANHAFAISGLDDREKTRGPLTSQRVELALKAAADHSYREQYQQRENNAARWQPETNTPSTLAPAANPGLRYSNSDQGNTRVHSWHLEQHGADHHELDDLVNAEMANMPPGLDPQQRHIQARINLLDTMLTQADAQLLVPPVGESQTAANVFTAPEWLFSGMIQGEGGELKAGGAMTEQEKNAAIRAVAQLSEKHPNMTIMAGSILWSKPVDGLHVSDNNGSQQHADLVLNTTPICANGNLLHTVEKLTDGGDAALAAKAFNPGGISNVTPSADNNFNTRIQVFPSDAAMNDAVKNGPLVPLAKEARSQGETPNNFLQVEGKTFAVEICADHSSGNVARNFRDSQQENPSPGVMARVIGEGGADCHVVIAAGAALNPQKCIAKPGAALAFNDLNTGVVMTATMGQVQMQRIDGTPMVKADGSPSMRPAFINPQSVAPAPPPIPLPPPPLPLAVGDHGADLDDDVMDIDGEGEDVVDIDGEDVVDIDGEGEDADELQAGEAPIIPVRNSMRLSSSQNALPSQIKL